LEFFKNFFRIWNSKIKSTNRNLGEPIEEEQTDYESLFYFYENRHGDNIKNSNINGIFYIINGEVFPDHFSESSFIGAASSGIHKECMFHKIFFEKYIRFRFPEASNYEFFPRGRVEVVSEKLSYIWIDYCHKDNIELIEKIKKLYKIRTPECKVKGGTYICKDCRENYFLKKGLLK